MEPFVSRHHGLLGTVIEMRVAADDHDDAAHVDHVVVAEIERLQGLLNARDPDSDLRRWSRGEIDPSPEVVEVVALADSWRERSRGAFEPAAGALFALWSAAERRGAPPSPDELWRAVLDLDAPGTRRRSFDPTAVAKGWIVDRAAAVGMGLGAASALTVNAGGDVVHCGEGVVRVGIEDPNRPFDNVPPLDVVALADAGLATSGGSRRGWTIGGRRHPQTLDPRTGLPVEGLASASALAPDAATADAVATVLQVLGPGEGLELVNGLNGVECLLVGRDGSRTTSPGWELRRA